RLLGAGRRRASDRRDRNARPDGRGRYRQRSLQPRARDASSGRDHRQPARSDGAGALAWRQRRAMILRRTAAYLWPYRWRVGLALAQVALISAFELLKPWPLQIVIDSVLGGRPVAWQGLAGLPPASLLAVAAIGLVLIYIVLGVIAVWNNYTTISIGQG